MALLVMGWNLSAPGAGTQGTPTRPAALCVAARQSSITREKHNGPRRCGGWRLCSIIPNFICWGYLLVASAACKGRDGNELGWSIPPQLLLGYVLQVCFPSDFEIVSDQFGGFPFTERVSDKDSCILLTSQIGSSYSTIVVLQRALPHNLQTARKKGMLWAAAGRHACSRGKVSPLPSTGTAQRSSADLLPVATPDCRQILSVIVYSKNVAGVFNVQTSQQIITGLLSAHYWRNQVRAAEINWYHFSCFLRLEPGFQKLITGICS